MSSSLILRECWWSMSCRGLGLCTDMEQRLHARRKAFHSTTHFPTHIPCAQHPWLPVVLGLRPPKPSPFHVSVSIGVSVPQVTLVRLHGQSFSHSSRRHSLTVNFLFFWFLQTFRPLFYTNLSLRCDNCIVDLSAGTWIHISPFGELWFSVMSQREVPWWRVKTTPICGYIDKQLEYS